MTLQKLNIIILLLWTVSGSLAQLFSWPWLDLLFTLLTMIVMFIMAGISLYYVLFYKHQLVVHDPPLLASVGLIVSIFIVPLLLFLADIFLPLHHTRLLALVYITLLLLPLGRSPLPFLLPDCNWRQLRIQHLFHPIILACGLILFVQLFLLNQYIFLPGLDAYTWLMTYDTNLSHQLYDLSAGINRTLFSTLVAIISRLAHASLFSIFKYYLPLLSLLPIIPLWLVARTLPGRLSQFLFLSSLLAAPAIILDWHATRHQLILLLFLYLAIGLLFTARRYQLLSLFWLTFIACFIGILYHPLFLVLIVFWLSSALMLHRSFINQHPLFSVFLAAIFFFAAHLLKLTSLITNLTLRLNDVFTNLLFGRWNLAYPSAFISEGVPMGWPGFLGVSKYYGYYAGPLPLFLIITTILLCLFSPSFRHRFSAAMRSPFLLPLTLLSTLLILLAEFLPRFTGIAYLPDRAWLLLSVTTLVFIPFIFNHLPSRPFSFVIIAGYSLAVISSTAGALYINHSMSYTMPDYEFAAAAWIKANLPAQSVVFTSSSKNILRYYAGVKLLPINQQLMSGNNAADILAHITTYRDKFDPSKLYIYYAITDPRNPFIDRPYASSFTQKRDLTSFPALDTNHDQFALIYSKPNLVYLWQVNILNP